MKESTAARRRRMVAVLDVLKKAYPGADCALEHEDPFQLLAATILSAQCTDKRVNMVTPALFRRYPDARAMAAARSADVERLIQSTGFYKNKARSLIECSKAIVARHDGTVPGTLEELTKLRGVGRKTANVVLGNAFGVPGLVVDTHVGRLTRRMGFTRQTDPEKIEREMMELVAREDWTLFAHLLISHGRARCGARKPDCDGCEVAALCPRVGVAKRSPRRS